MSQRVIVYPRNRIWQEAGSKNHYCDVGWYQLILSVCFFLPAAIAHADEPTHADEPKRAVAPFSAQQAQKYQTEWSRHLGREVVRTNHVGMRFVLLPPGEFLMGCPPELLDQSMAWADRVRQLQPGTERQRIREEECPQHPVILTKPYELSVTEVTIGQFRRFVDARRYVTETERFGGGNSALSDEKDQGKRKFLWHTPGYKITENSPVTQITWNDCVAYCNWLSGNEGFALYYQVNPDGNFSVTPGANGYRLPTEAEWEFACRGGATEHFSFGNDVSNLEEYAWYDKNADHLGAGQVASKKPNPFGLYDMHGNAWERCQDWHAVDWYKFSPIENPTGPVNGIRRIARGGAWHYFDLHCRCSYRNNYSPIGRTGNIGFRVARSLVQVD